MKELRKTAAAALILVAAGVTASTLPSVGGGSLALADTAATVDFERDIQPIFDEHCVMCHMTGAENGGLNLEPGKSRANLTNVRSTESALERVAPGNPARSYLLQKIKGAQLQAGGSGVQMPLGGPPLDPQQIQLIERWINSTQS